MVWACDAKRGAQRRMRAMGMEVQGRRRRRRRRGRPERRWLYSVTMRGDIREKGASGEEDRATWSIQHTSTAHNNNNGRNGSCLTWLRLPHRGKAQMACNYCFPTRKMFLINSEF